MSDFLPGVSSYLGSDWPDLQLTISSQAGFAGGLGSVVALAVRLRRTLISAMAAAPFSCTQAALAAAISGLHKAVLVEGEGSLSSLTVAGFSLVQAHGASSDPSKVADELSRLGFVEAGAFLRDGRPNFRASVSDFRGWYV